MLQLSRTSEHQSPAEQNISANKPTGSITGSLVLKSKYFQNLQCVVSKSRALSSQKLCSASFLYRTLFRVGPSLGSPLFCLLDLWINLHQGEVLLIGPTRPLSSTDEPQSHLRDLNRSDSRMFLSSVSSVAEAVLSVLDR